MKGQDTTHKSRTRGPRKISDATIQGRLGQSQRNKHTNGGSGIKHNRVSDGEMRAVRVSR